MESAPEMEITEDVDLHQSPPEEEHLATVVDNTPKQNPISDHPPTKPPRSQKQIAALDRARTNLAKKRASKALEEETRLMDVQTEINRLLKENEELRTKKREPSPLKRSRSNRTSRKRERETSSDEEDEQPVIEKPRGSGRRKGVESQPVHVPAVSLMRSFGF